jgi:hypothetical protein
VIVVLWFEEPFDHKYEVYPGEEVRTTLPPIQGWIAPEAEIVGVKIIEKFTTMSVEDTGQPLSEIITE